MPSRVKQVAAAIDSPSDISMNDAYDINNHGHAEQEDSSAIV